MFHFKSSLTYPPNKCYNPANAVNEYNNENTILQISDIVVTNSSLFWSLRWIFIILEEATQTPFFFVENSRLVIILTG